MVKFETRKDYDIKFIRTHTMQKVFLRMKNIKET